MEDSNNGSSNVDQPQDQQQQQQQSGLTLLQPSAVHDSSNPLHKLFQSVAVGNSPIQSPSPPPKPSMDDSNNVMRFFSNITPTPTPPPIPLIPTQSPTPPPSSIVSFLENSIIQQQQQNKPSTPPVDIYQQQQQQQQHHHHHQQIKQQTNLSFSGDNALISHSGVYLSGKDVEVNECQSLPKLADLETQHITVMPCAIKYIWGSMISVNANYICYIVKGEKIRVLERSSTQRALVKDIRGEISHIQFIADQVDLLSCSTTDGLVYIFDIAMTSSAITPQLLNQFVLDPSSNTPGKTIMPKTAWSPIAARNNLQFTVGGANINALYVYSHDQPSGVHKIPLSAPSHAFAYDTTGHRLVFGTEDGTIGIWDIRLSIMVFEHQLPLQAPVHFISFIDANTLVIGTSNNREVILFHLPSRTFIQKLKLVNANATSAAPVLLAMREDYLIAISSDSPKGYMVHLAEARQLPPHFDYLSEFDVTKPVISFTVRPAVITPKSSISNSNLISGVTGERKDKKFHFFSIQATGVNFHSIQESALFLPTDRYIGSESNVVQQFGQIDAVPASSIADHTVPNKMFVPSSPPPLSLPDPSLLKAEMDSFETAESGSDTGKGKKNNGSNKKLTKSPSAESTSKVNLNTPDSLLPVAPAANPSDTLLSPNAIQQLQQVASPIQPQKKPAASTTPTSTTPTPTTPQKDKLTATIGVPPKTTPTKAGSAGTAPKKIPSFKQASINIPSSSSTNLNAVAASSTPTSTTPTIPAIAIHQQEQSSAPSTPPPQATTPISTPTPVTTTTETTSSSSPNNLSSSSDRLEKLIGKQMELLESARSEQAINAIQNSVQATVKASLEKIVKKELAPMVANLERTIAASHEQLLLKVTQDAVKKLSVKSDSVLKTSMDSITTQIKSSVITDAIEASVKPVVESVFLNYFQNILVPGFEKSCNTMFKQLSASFDKGMTELLQHNSLSSQAQFLSMEKLVSEKMKSEREEMQQLLFQLMKQQSEMQNDIKFLLSTVDNRNPLNGPGPMMGGNRMPDSNMMHMYSPQQQHFANFPQPPQIQHPHLPLMPVIPSPPPSRSSILQPYPELKSFIESGDYSSAFNYALNSKNLKMVVDLCSATEPSEVYSSRKSLHNTTIISLVQQLSNDFISDVDLKLKWIKESLLHFDINEPSIKSVATQILHSLKTKIETNPTLITKEYYAPPILSTLKLMLK